MKKTLYVKFVLIYIILGILGFLFIATLGSQTIQYKILQVASENLYKEAISISSYNASVNYNDEEEIEAAYHTLVALAMYQDAHILIHNPSGAVLIDTAKPYSPEPIAQLPTFDPAAMGSGEYGLAVSINTAPEGL